MIVASQKWNLKHILSFNIQRRFSLILAASMIMILILSVIGLHYLYSHYITVRAQSDAVSISQSFLAVNKSLFTLDPDEELTPLDINSVRNQKLDEEFRLFLPPFHVIKLKIFSADKIIIFSTEQSLIGQTDHNNKRLDEALAGFNSSKIQTENEIMDLQFESQFDVDVVETYVPIFDLTGRIVGSFEIYQDMTHLRHYIVQGVILATSVLICILLVIYFIAFKMINITTKELDLSLNTLERLASIDSLTSIYNRDYIFKELNIEVARSLREKKVLSTILFDLDFFKNVNDCYGHQFGDEVLQKVAQIIQDNIRQYDSVGRYGGEEFLVVLPNADEYKAADVAERVRTSIENMSIKCGEKVVKVTISAGVSTLNVDETNIEKLIKRADKALYAAKKNGRNQVIVAPTVATMELKATT